MKTGKPLGVRVFMLFMVLALVGVFSAQNIHAAEPEAYDQETVATLASGWSAFYNNQPAKAIKAVNALTHSANASTRWHALHIQARSLWITGDQASQRQALAIWNQISHECRGNPFATARVEIGQALHLAGTGQVQQGIDLLEAFRKKQLPSSATVEAAIELALLDAEAKHPQAAQAQLDAASAMLQYSESNGIPGVMHNALLLGVEQAKKAVQNPGWGLFARAKGLQREGKDTNALALFIQVVRDYPTSDYADRSQFEMGVCEQSMGKSQLAIQQWKKFIASAPAGPWRGQALTALIDLYLVEQLDIQSASTYSELARTSLPQALAQGDSMTSWQPQAYDIYLRVGIVNFCLGRSAIAAEAFEQAKQLTKNKVYVERLDALVAAVKAKQPIIPADCVTASSTASSIRTAASESGLSKPALALSLGMIHLLTGQRDLASEYFDRVLGTPAIKGKAGEPDQPARPGLEDATSAQKSFAIFGQAAVLQAQGRDAQAKKQFIASVMAYKDGSWLDETLYRIASLVGDMAFKRFGRGEPTDKERLVKYAKAKAEALPYWQEIVSRYPKSLRAEVALYQTGVLTYAQAINAPNEIAGELFKNAATAFGRLSKDYPKSLYNGDAYVHHMDIALERMYDINLAQAIAERSVEWARSQEVAVTTHADGTITKKAVDNAARVIKVDSAKLPLWADPHVQQAKILLDDIYNLYLRAGIIAYLQGKYEEADKFFDAAGPARPTNGMQANFDLQKVGVHILKVSCKRKQLAWDEDALAMVRDDHQKLAIKLADTYILGQRAEKGQAIYVQLMNGDPPLGPPSKAVEGYCVMRLALAYSQEKINYDKSVEYYKLFYKKEYASLPWAPEAIMRLAVLEYNKTQDPHVSIPCYKYILKHYPDHPDAERALYFLALDAVEIGDKELAESSCREFLGRYPKSGWGMHIRSVMKNELPKLLDKKVSK